MRCGRERLGIYRGTKRKCDEDTNHVATAELTESRDMMEMPGMISTSAEPGILADVMPDGLRHMNSGEMEGEVDSGYSSKHRTREGSDERTRSSLGGLDENGSSNAPALAVYRQSRNSSILADKATRRSRRPANAAASQHGRHFNCPPLHSSSLSHSGIREQNVSVANDGGMEITGWDPADISPNKGTGWNPVRFSRPTGLERLDGGIILGICLSPGRGLQRWGLQPTLAAHLPRNPESHCRLPALE